MNTDEIKINKIRLASELAANEIMNNHNEEDEVFINANLETLEYKEEIQKEFNLYYDEFLTFIENNSI